MTATVQQLINACQQLTIHADKVTSTQRINAAHRVDMMIPNYGPSWTAFASFSLVNGHTERTMDADQFRAFLAAKHTFAAQARASVTA